MASIKTHDSDANHTSNIGKNVRRGSILLGMEEMNS